MPRMPPTQDHGIVFYLSTTRKRSGISQLFIGLHDADSLPTRSLEKLSSLSSYRPYILLERFGGAYLPNGLRLFVYWFPEFEPREQLDPSIDEACVLPTCSDCVDFIIRR
jgi:hypothetical protein